ncbi:MAG: Uncharacterised protein [Cryomorphaceae bacterium]|nr:MAG: Uncharacterised protein [Cryomorphaceae bacterium]
MGVDAVALYTDVTGGFRMSAVCVGIEMNIKEIHPITSGNGSGPVPKYHGFKLRSVDVPGSSDVANGHAEVRKWCV